MMDLTTAGKMRHSPVLWGGVISSISIANHVYTNADSSLNGWCVIALYTIGLKAWSKIRVTPFQCFDESLRLTDSFIAINPLPWSDQRMGVPFIC